MAGLFSQLGINSVQFSVLVICKLTRAQQYNETCLKLSDCPRCSRKTSQLHFLIKQNAHSEMTI